MPDSNDRLAEIKTILRSLLIAKANTKVTLRQLNGMYKEMEEHYIPFRNFGFLNMVDFMKSIGDTVSLYTDYATCEICVRHVDTEKSAHITSLVSRQQKKKPTAKKRPSYRPPYNYSRSCSSPSNYSYKQSPTAYKKPFANYSKPTSSYNEMFTGTANNNFNSKSTNNFFTNTAANYYNSKPLNSFSTNISNNYNSKPISSYSTNTANNYNSKPMNSFSTNTVYNSKPTNNNYGISNSYSSKPAQPCRDALAVLKMVLKDMKNTKSTNGICKVDVLSRVKYELSQAGRDPNALYSMQNLNAHLDELWDEVELKEDYIYFRAELAIIKEQERQKLNEKKSPTITDCQDELPSTTCREQKESNKSFVEESPISKDLNRQTVEVMDTTSQYSGCCQESVSPSLKSNSTSDLIKDTVKFRLQKLIESHPEGIWCSELPNVYKKTYDLNLDYHELGFSCITEFVAALPEIFELTRPLDNRLMVLNANKPTNDSSNNHQRKTLASIYNFDDYIAKDPDPVPLQLSSNTSQKLFPDGVMKPNESVESISVVTLSAMEYTEVNISEVFTPSFFWVTLRENKKKFKAMMNELDEFYRYRDLDTYRIPQLVLEAGLNIACVYARIWHRGIIKKIKPDGFVVILFYDYGTVSTYHPCDVYFLHTRFSALPAQAIASGLCNTKPIGSTEWPPNCTQAFVDKVWNIPLIAIVASINEENNTMMITLTDTTDDDNDLHINDWMVDNNFAEWGKMIKDVPLHTMTLYDEMNSRHRYSTHKETKKSSTKCSSNTTLTSNFNDSDSFHTAASVATLVQETIGYVKQTHTITQAILLNTPFNKSDDFSNSNIQGLRNEKIESKVFENNGFVSLETFNTPVNPDFNDNLSSIKTNLSIKNNCSETNSIRNECRPQSQNSRNESDYELPVSDINQNCQVEAGSVSQNFKNGSDQEVSVIRTNQNGYAESHHDANEYIKRRSSIHSSSSHMSDYSQSINIELNGTEEYDRFQLKDGTLSFERVVENNYRNPTINIKYPSKFAALHADKFENNIDPVNANSDGDIKPRDEIDEGYQTGSRQSLSRTHGSSGTCSTPPFPPTYIELRLSEKCGNKLIHIFHLQNNGWVCMNEVVDAFTNYYDERVLMKLIEVLQFDITLHHLTRETDPQLFSKLDKSQLKAPRNDQNKIVSDFVLTLMTCKNMVQLLIDLDFIDSEMVKEAIPLMKKPKVDTEDILYQRFNNKILFNALNVVVQYRIFKRAQEMSAK